ncbi:MAG TPA: cation diffusion facilitator family transporter [Chloroflexia bacterium]|nr:cation diffusion facilitator family transporter [Chloroflexia bacterium]
MSHTHVHVHAAPAVERRLLVAVLVTAAIVLLEASGGLVAHSLALVADAGHVFADLFALGLTWFALRQARRPADARRTFGYHRVGILTALLNAASLLPISALLVYEGIVRLFTPVAVESGVMLGVAAVGLLANAGLGLTLHNVAGSNLNIRSAVIHLAGDAAAAGGVVVGAIIIALTGWTPIDPLLTIAISLMIAVSGWRLLRDTLRILLESVPTGISTDDVVRVMRSVPGVQDVHDLHIWSLASGINALSCHVLIADQSLSSWGGILAALNHKLDEAFQIGHSTIQPECADCDPKALYCVLVPAGEPHVHSTQEVA